MSIFNLDWRILVVQLFMCISSWRNSNNLIESFLMSLLEFDFFSLLFKHTSYKIVGRDYFTKISIYVLHYSSFFWLILTQI